MAGQTAGHHPGSKQVARDWQSAQSVCAVGISVPDGSHGVGWCGVGRVQREMSFWEHLPPLHLPSPPPLGRLLVGVGVVSVSRGLQTVITKKGHRGMAFWAWRSDPPPDILTTHMGSSLQPSWKLLEGFLLQWTSRTLYRERVTLCSF